MSPIDPKPLAFDDTWALARVTLGSDTIFLRFRQHLLPLAGVDQLPNRLSVVWLYDSEPLEGSQGMPSPQLQAEMTALEDALAGSLESRGIAILTSVATGVGRREWTWYCCEQEVLAKGVNEALAPHPRFPIRISIAADPDWQTYRQLLADVSGEGA
jgi:uncharacterized protein DUF695